MMSLLQGIKRQSPPYLIRFRDLPHRLYCITTDKGWKIILGRGLDIFETYGKYSMANSQQSKRKQQGQGIGIWPFLEVGYLSLDSLVKNSVTNGKITAIRLVQMVEALGGQLKIVFPEEEKSE